MGVGGGGGGGELSDGDGVAQKKNTERNTSHKYVDAITGINVWDNFSWKIEDHQFWFSFVFVF